MALDKSSNKVKEISDILYKETILPAKEESERMIEEAKEAAAGIIHKAQEEAKELLERNRKQMEDEAKVHGSSIDLSVKQAVATLKAEVMNVFNNELLVSLKDVVDNQNNCQSVLDALVNGIKENGVTSDLKLFVSKRVDFKALSDSVISRVERKLEKGDMPISSGIALMIKDKKFTLKITDQTLNELLADKLPEVLRGRVFA
ncbi:MAG: V-type proton ATPase subunit E [Chlamydiia bacterium]|nr:V-type proton ATPase subunit E [Chlamydiia bacterium]